MTKNNILYIYTHLETYNYISRISIQSVKITVDWTELQNEEEYRQKLRDQQEARENQPIDWDDETEREFRQKYTEQRYAILKAIVYNVPKINQQHITHNYQFYRNSTSCQRYVYI